MESLTGIRGKVSLTILSLTTIVVHNRDAQEVDVAHEVKLPENQPQFSQMMMGQYCLGITKPKQAFRSTQNEVATVF